MEKKDIKNNKLSPLQNRTLSFMQVISLIWAIFCSIGFIISLIYVSVGGEFASGDVNTVLSAGCYIAASVPMYIFAKKYRKEIINENIFAVSLFAYAANNVVYLIFRFVGDTSNMPIFGIISNSVEIVLIFILAVLLIKKYTNIKLYRTLALVLLAVYLAGSIQVIVDYDISSSIFLPLMMCIFGLIEPLTYILYFLLVKGKEPA